MIGERPPFSVPLPRSRHAQTVSFDLTVSKELPAIDWVPVFVHGRSDYVGARRQAVFIDVRRRALYATVWHSGLRREVILCTKDNVLSEAGPIHVLFSVSTILGIYSLFVDGQLAAQIVEPPGEVSGGNLVEMDCYELLNEPGLSIANLSAYGEYVTPGVRRPEHFSCLDLEKQVNLSWSGGKENLTFCCFMHNRRGVDVGFLPILGVEIEGSKLPLGRIAAERQRIKDVINHGEEETACHGCPRLQHAVWPENPENKLITVTVNSWTACNLRCEYCFTIDAGTPFIAKPSYNLLEMFRNLAEEGKFEAGASVTWGGGDVTVLVGFEEASAFLTETGISQLVNTNAITFSPAIAAGLARGLMDVQVSIDAGTRALYDAVKGRDHLDAVWRNVERYHKISMEVKERGATRLPYPIVAKYIIYHNNCEPAELLEFMRRCRLHGMRFIVISAKQGELMPNGRNGHLSLQPDAGAEERILRGVALLRSEAAKSQIRSALYTFSPAQERLIDQYEHEIPTPAF
jgi:pyruvate-formate lyase-activating enzyme